MGQLGLEVHACLPRYTDEVSGQFHVPAVKERPVFTEYKAVRAPEPVCSCRPSP
jgi:hypothetical protein